MTDEKKKSFHTRLFTNFLGFLQNSIMPIHSESMTQLKKEMDRALSCNAGNYGFVHKEILNLQESRRIMKADSEEQSRLIVILCEILDDIIAKNDKEQVISESSFCV